MNRELANNGERMVPEETYHETFREHVMRYRFACGLVKGLRVLDLACGEGYGSNALNEVAKSVVGVDISEECVRHAHAKYGIRTLVGSAEAIPLKDATLDAVVSFETIEHVPDPATFVQEISRVLTERGIAIVSTPNKQVYNQLSAPNPHHCSEMTPEEFTSLLGVHFKQVIVYGQRGLRLPIHRWEKFGHDLFGRAVKKIARTAISLTYHQSDRWKNDSSATRKALLSRMSAAPSLGLRHCDDFWPRELRQPSDQNPVYLIAVCRK